MNAAVYRTCVTFIEFAIHSDCMLVAYPHELSFVSLRPSGCVFAQVDVRFTVKYVLVSLAT